MTAMTERQVMDNTVHTGERALGSFIMDIPGMVCKHGCSYVACRGLVLSPINGLCIITHGPVGCSYYAWGGNRLRHRFGDDGPDFYRYSLSTRMDESDIIFGGEKKLQQAIEEAVKIFHPPVIAICSTCPIGLIGDDVQSIAAVAEKEHGIKVLAFDCEGFRSVPGYRLATMGIVKDVIGSGNRPVGPYPVNIIGEFYNGHRAREISRILEYIGYDIVAVLMGDGSYEGLENAHQARLNLFCSDKVVADLVEVMQERFGIDWMGFNFIGMDNIINSLKNMAAYFKAPELQAKTAALIAEELAQVQHSMDDCRRKLRGRIAVIQEDEFVSRHYQALCHDLELHPVMVGHELLCSPGQNELNFLSAAQSGSSTINACPGVRYDIDLEHFHINLPARLYQQISTQTGLKRESTVHCPVPYDSILISNLSHEKTGRLFNALQPDIIFPGINELFAGVGSGYSSCFFNADDFRLDYGGFQGAVHFAQDLLRAMNLSDWHNNIAPWKICI